MSTNNSSVEAAPQSGAVPLLFQSRDGRTNLLLAQPGAVEDWRALASNAGATVTEVRPTQSRVGVLPR